MASKLDKGRTAALPDLGAALAALQAHAQKERPKPPPGYYSVEEYLESSGTSPARAQQILRNSVKAGLMDRILISKTYYYKSK